MSEAGNFIYLNESFPNVEIVTEIETKKTSDLVSKLKIV